MSNSGKPSRAESPFAPASSVPRSLPRGNHGLDRDVVLMSQRARLLEAIVEVVAEKGYAATTVQDITRRARVSRTTFYEQFSDKEQCFLAAYEGGSQAHFEHVATAVRRAPGWFEKMHAGTLAYLEVLAENPSYARTFLIEVQAAGRPALAQRVVTHRRYADALAGWYAAARAERPHLPPLPQEAFAGVVGAIDEIVAGRVRDGDVRHLAEAAPTLLYLELAVLGLAEEARAMLPEA